MTFLEVMGKNAPAFTVASLAIIMTRRVSIRARPVITPAAGAPPHSSYMPWAANSPNSKKLPASTSRSIRSRPVLRPLLCWLSIALGPPPSQIFSPSLRTCDIRSARNRMLASKRADVGSTFVARTFDGAEAFCVGVSLRSAMVEGSGLFTVYQPSRHAQTELSSRTIWSPRRNGSPCCLSYGIFHDGIHQPDLQRVTRTNFLRSDEHFQCPRLANQPRQALS